MMIDSVLPGATVVAAVGSGLMAGLFFAFSAAVMPGLRRLRPEVGAAAMQAINRAILNPVFGVVFGGTPLLCLLMAVAAPFSSWTGAGWIVAGAVLHVVGSFGLTMVANVPLNNRLDAADPDSPAGVAVWADYLVRWTAWNHVRTALCAAATAALALAV
ncbi:DUF1772 domain-containing protein [Pseudonocardia sp. CA-142604]|uniref:anthrone oxygenase family protein n=1 Tax=Pseudonocardia sp. CA-142604 TaxID=3240024 RepID=UPI003D93ABCC